MSAVAYDLVVQTCINCGVRFAMDEAYNNRKLDDHTDFCCPNGHQQHYTGEREVDRLRKETENLRMQLANSRSWAQAETQRTEEARRQAAAARGVATKMRKQRDKIQARVKHGVCPCCKRTFKQLAAHMKGKHPNYPEK